MLYVGTGWMRWMGWEGIGYRRSLVYKSTCGAKKKRKQGFGRKCKLYVIKVGGQTGSDCVKCVFRSKKQN